ncbi:Uncharacterised protein [Starkeya nomas]|uniref:Uncharacterized protein n=1 Tax=Starkeya nomas TaxID=2666134 RepID=A0A5S9NA61_9HYPH|nr:hypothetical protein [Starkeya nomas]CAA0086835.1 Uncharacterised protein [Starkeya nomas]
MKGTDRKRLVARMQIGTALHLFLNDMNPVSVHVLACAGCEILGGLAKTDCVPSLLNVLLDGQQQLSEAELVRSRVVFYNAMKHHNDKRGQPRDDERLLESFSDEANDGVLFEAWFNYGQVATQMPVEAQVFTMWIMALSGGLDGRERAICDHLFPGLKIASRREQKQQMRLLIEDVHKQGWVSNDPRTEAGSLLMPLSAFDELQSRSSGVRP